MSLLDYSDFIKYELKLNTSYLSNNHRNSSIHNFYKKISKLEGICGYCNSSLHKAHEKSSISQGFNSEIGYHSIGWECINCGYWEIEIKNPFEGGNGIYNGLDIHHRKAILRKFKEDDNFLPIQTLRKYLSTNESLLNNISPLKMEQLVKSIFSDYLDCEIIHCGKSYDGGIDLLAIENNNDTIAFQIKRRSNYNKSESVSLIREFLGAMIIKGIKKGVIISTAKKFSNSSKKTVDSIISDNIVNQFDLIDREKFFSIFKLTNGHDLRPWERHYKKIYFSPYGIID